MDTLARFASLAFGLVMVSLGVVGAHGLSLAVGVAAADAVGAGTAVPPAATLAVVIAVATIMLSAPAVAFVALSGFCAAAYLVCRYAVGSQAGVVMGSVPTVAAGLGFTVAGLAATAFPLHLPWLPLVAPLGVLAIYVLAARPFLS
ncbi:hypothetical protein [Mycobacterium sp. Marseille-P9652]|uniref:hypothetical protein n=1 Tax=Mycobacterium sp. Marseille-P9652 TaxID=2654950 RepID=UPI0012E7CD99|nr:hypothetical protein [Mycobacterium sp. Marseille-P9652]